MRIGLVGCVKSKRVAATAAKDLYTSTLSRGRRRFVERTCARWFVLSAKHGLVEPDQVIEPYDVALRIASRDARRRWSADVLAALVMRLGSLVDHVFELHTDSAYRDFGLVAGLRALGATVETPGTGLTQGRLLAFYRRASDARGTPKVPSPRRAVGIGSVPTAAAGLADRIVVEEVREIGAFEYRWPENVEAFTRGWEGVIRVGGRPRAFRHGVGARTVYGRRRVHSVTWLDRAPMVEGVEPDDFATSTSLVSVLRLIAGRGLVRQPSGIPPGYAGFRVVELPAEILAPRVWRGLAVKVRIDDLSAWAQHAILREAGRRRTAGSAQPPATGGAPATSNPPARRPAGQTAEPAAALPVDPQAVVRGLLAFQRSLAAARHGAPPVLVPHREANLLVTRDPFAFLLGVIFDQGVSAERAWTAPYELRARLRHLDPVRIAADPDTVRTAFRAPPLLHRFPNKLPPWIVGAAARVVGVYLGNAGNIWGDQPTARDLQARLVEFDGIGQKKAAMAVEILERELGVALAQMDGSDIAYDVHVRRTMLRTGLADRDEMRHMVECARRHYPKRPGALDNPLWHIGRRWCHPKAPDCAACAISAACPMLISRADGVRGA